MTMALEQSSVAIREATRDDLQVVIAIEQASFGDPWSAQDFDEILASPQTIFLIAAASDGAVVGYAIAMFVADESEILNLAVSSSHRRHGYGGMLLDAAIAELGTRGIASVFLEVRESNAAARTLYASRGFADVSRRKKYYRNPVEDALILRLALQR
jgi:ribosomal-protein-alanine N-acetyltransferase